ncbi:MAG: MarR family winged helix-turn-helix transcriptional regulator [Candidatus Limnocylindria bacterium]
MIAVFDRMMHKLMADHAPELTAIDLTMAQTKALYIVLAAGELRMSDLAARLGVTSSTATGVVDRLVELGLVERHELPSDRRQVVIVPTRDAAVAVERFRELNSRRMRDMLSRVPVADLATVERALSILDAALPEPAPSSTAHHEGNRS